MKPDARRGAYRFAFHLYGLLSPAGAARAAASLWFTVPKPRPEPDLPPGLQFGVDVDGHPVRGTRWGSGPQVYLMHGWAGRQEQFGPLVHALVAAGYGVVAFDAPNHGRSGPGASGRRHTHAVEFARALAAVIDRHGPAYAVVAHSLGAVAVGLAVRFGWVDLPRLVLVAPLTGVRPPLEDLAAQLALPERVRRHLDRPVEARTGVRVDDFRLDGMVGRTDASVLVLHDRGDRRSSYTDAAALVEPWPGAVLVPTEGLGHRRILADPGVAGGIVEFLAEGDLTPGQRSGSVPSRRAGVSAGPAARSRTR